MKKGVPLKTFRVMFVLIVAVIIAGLLVNLAPEADRKIPVETGRLVEVMPVQAQKVRFRHAGLDKPAPHPDVEASRTY
jgi:hypothetical protein